ncbi:MAG: chromosome segregation protein SMC, partial [Deltaproteobacteria bacterium]|nr:chromosome segregation protein SMC [Deltaproteobacteria bacterium]
MKIKKIFVNGFKSFMDRMEVPFPLGISAIVGPNGCGKSNMVDAIRWAMGEQSAKQLRGRHMEDVIFNGTGDHKALGMAEVSIIFENGHGSFPPPHTDASEISVTRRLYRSGESEYLVNNIPCRLKDIQEIFMDTGLGNRAYSIIGQGTIGSIVEQRPEDTRAMLEEAAGITKYKKKVEESRRKIELTKGNLQRVEDILVEVQRQMRSLKRQAAKARRFKAIGEKIQRLEVILNANSYKEWKEESSSRLASTETLLQDEMARSTELSRIHADLESMHLDLDKKDEEIAQLRNVYLECKEKVNRKESILDSLAGEKRMQAELENRLKKEKAGTEMRLNELQDEHNTLVKQVEQVKQTAERLEEDISLLDQRLKGRQASLKQVKEEYEEARSQLNSGVSKEVSLTQESGYLSKRIGEITDSRSRLEKEKVEIGNKMEELTGVSKRKTEIREALAKKLRDIDEDIHRVSEERNELDRMKKAAETDLKTAETDLNIYETRLSSLRTMTENFEGYKVGVRTIMKAQDLDVRREGRILGLVADMIQVEPRLEQAVEAVLADKLQYIVVERQQDGKEAIDYLKIRAKGRSSFIPLKEFNGHKNNGHYNGFPLLRDLVSVSEPYRHLIHLLLGNAAVVQDLDKAIAAWQENGKDQCLVTPDGDLVDINGVISGGKLAHSSHGILARKREIGELSLKVEKRKKDREASVNRFEQITREISQKEACLNELMDEKSDCQDKINDLDKTIFRLSHELDQLEKLLVRISEDLDQNNKKHQEHNAALSRIESEIARCKEKRRRVEEYVAE